MQYLGQYSINKEACGNFAVADIYKRLVCLAHRFDIVKMEQPETFGEKITENYVGSGTAA